MYIDHIPTGERLSIKITGMGIEFEAVVCKVKSIVHKFAELQNGEEIFHQDIEWYERKG